MNQIIVLETKGKNESVDMVAVHLFNSIEDALKFCASQNVNFREKYWTKAEVVKVGEFIELASPF